MRGLRQYKHAPHARLIGIGKSAPGEYALDKRKIRIGTSPDNDLIIDNPTVSKRHAIIRRRFRAYTLTPLNSTNGTFVHNQRVTGSIKIRKGYELRFGGARFVFVGCHPSDRKTSGAKFITALALLGFLFLAGFGVADYIVNWSALERYANFNDGQSAHPLRTSDATNDQQNRQMSKPSIPLTSPSPSAPAGSTTTLSMSMSSVAVPNWLDRVNYWRDLAKVSSVGEDSELSKGDMAHARYIVQNYSRLIRSYASLAGC
jgi:pSer/pThr/pTyr-binding forkhead associated (FHA) protein